MSTTTDIFNLNFRKFRLHTSNLVYLFLLIFYYGESIDQFNRNSEVNREEPLALASTSN